MLKRYLENGWVVLRQKGPHIVVGKGSAREVIPVHGSQDLKRGLEVKLLKRLEK